ncbi:hypothetical protein PG994_009911, partial [Apiospora phragmitis]
ICLVLIKVSFLLLYRRLFRPVTLVKAMVWTGISLLVASTVVYIIMMPVACSPWPSEHDDWLDLGMAERCAIIGSNLITAMAYFSVITDFYILIIPLHQVPQLRLSTGRKVGISFIFLTAIAAGLTNLIFRQNKTSMDPADFSWNIVPIYASWCVNSNHLPPREHLTLGKLFKADTAIWRIAMAEINVGLIALSMPVILAQFVGRLTGMGKSLSSWIRNRRTPPHSIVGDASDSDLTTAGADQSPRTPHRQLPHHQIPDATLSGMRKFIRNLQGSRAASASRGSFSGHDGVNHNYSHNMGTFDDLTSADFSYHVQLKAMRASESTTRVEKSGTISGHHSRREDEMRVEDHLPLSLMMHMHHSSN